jgi:thioredoxin:protein disulfide reductase
MKTLSYIFSVCLCIFSNIFSYNTPDYSTKSINPNTVEVTITYNLEPDEYLYKDSISLFVDHPSYTLAPIKYSKEYANRYDTNFKKTKAVFDDTVSLTATITVPAEHSVPASLHAVTTTNKNGTQEIVIPITLQAQNISTISEPLAHENSAVEKAPLKKSNQETTSNFSISEYISHLVKTINSPFMRVLLVYLLGILLSLTPCIYPMVPITIGILQAQGSKSFFYNFLSALSYTCGIAVTFASFGLLASCTGPLCGQLLMEPLFIIGLVTLLIYLGFSMLGFYDVRVPKFLQPTNQNFKGGSLVSTFIFGAASGTIASPCVSPGLVLLLSIVATLNSKILGFLLLFVFGVGLSTPLLIVGAFSSSLALMPRAGIWMIEVKKLFGFMIFGMCFYYINYIIPTPILLWFLAIFIAVAGLYYSYSGQKMVPGLWKKINFWIGCIALITSIVVFFQAYRAITYAKKDAYDEHKNLWHTSYDEALKQAKNEGKKLFIDFWATFCPICLAINKTVLTKPAIIKALQEKYVLLKVDGSHNSNVPYATLRSKFPVKGFPTFYSIDPATESILREFGGEIYDMPEEEFIKVLGS